VLFSGAAAAQAAQETSSWTWTDYGPALLDVSCSSQDKCVAVGQRGAVLRSKGQALAWSAARLDDPTDELDGVTCHGGSPTDTFCLAVSNESTLGAGFKSKIYRSTDNGATWSKGVELPATVAPKTQSARAVACDPAADACYAVGPAGGAWRSLDQGRSWSPLELPKTPGSYRRVACPAKEKCVAVGGSSSAIIEGDKLRSLPKPAFGPPEGLACDKPTRCTATAGAKYASLDLSVPEPKWGAPQLFPAGTSVSALACPAQDECVGVGKSVDPVSVRTMSLSAGVWTRLPIPFGASILGAISCEQIGCVAVGEKAAWFADPDVVDAGEWERVTQLENFNVVYCSLELSPLCVAGGDKLVAVSRAKGKLWSWPFLKDALNTNTVHCKVPSECLILGTFEADFTDDLIKFDPRKPANPGTAGSELQTCITQVLCVGLGTNVVYTTPNGGQTGWVQSRLEHGKPKLLACVPGRTDPPTCLVVAGDFVYRGTMLNNDPKTWKWVTAVDLAPLFAPLQPGVMGLACSPGGQCTGVAAEGVVLTSEGDLRKWTKHVLPSPKSPVEDRPALMSVACPAINFCLAGGHLKANAIIASTTDFWANFTLDQIPPITPGQSPTIKAFSCESVNRCVAVGDTVLVGRRKIGRTNR
jgi:hypothetical protein